MTRTQVSPVVSEEYLAELAECGQEIYDKLKTQLEPEFNGQHIAIHVDSGDYVIAKLSTLTTREMLRRHPADGRLYGRKIGPDPDDDFVARLAALEVLAERSK